jgi:hypothetical protein
MITYFDSSHRLCVVELRKVMLFCHSKLQWRQTVLITEESWIEIMSYCKRQRIRFTEQRGFVTSVEMFRES